MNISMQTLRGLAIMAVVLTHAQFDPTQIQANYIIQNLINIGVAGFIFLSGYFTNGRSRPMICLFFFFIRTA